MKTIGASGSRTTDAEPPHELASLKARGADRQLRGHDDDKPPAWSTRTGRWDKTDAKGSRNLPVISRSDDVLREKAGARIATGADLPAGTTASGSRQWAAARFPTARGPRSQLPSAGTKGRGRA